jgi:hypothetical protein
LILSLSSNYPASPFDPVVLKVGASEGMPSEEFVSFAFLELSK